MKSTSWLSGWARAARTWPAGSPRPAWRSRACRLAGGPDVSGERLLVATGRSVDLGSSAQPRWASTAGPPRERGRRQARARASLVISQAVKAVSTTPMISITMTP
jgi:hypothetical protein